MHARSCSHLQNSLTNSPTINMPSHTCLHYRMPPSLMLLILLCTLMVSYMLSFTPIHPTFIMLVKHAIHAPF